MSIRAGSFVVVTAFALAGCYGGKDEAVACSTARLYYGSSAPPLLGLSEGQRLAIGRVVPESAPGVLCTGALVSAAWVITARHCDVGGTLTFAVGSAPAAATIVSSVEVVRHPEVDVALFRVDHPEALARGGTEPIQVLGGSLDMSWRGRLVQLAGMGLTEDGHVGNLEFLAEPIVGIDNANIVVDGSGHSGACAGDSGGPLLVQGMDGRVRTAGVLSVGSPDCLGVDRYTRLDAVGGWIRLHVPPEPAPCE